MFELTIKNEVYQFNCGMGFLREVNKRMQTPVEGVKDAKQNIGLRYMVAGVLDGDVECWLTFWMLPTKDLNPV